MKVLILRFSSIGDIVLTSPVIRCLKKQLGAEIHYLTKHSFENIVASNPYIDQVYTFTKNIKEVIGELKLNQYDQVIDLHHNLRTAHLKLLLGRPASTFPKLNWEKWKMVNLKINHLPNVHIVHRYFEAVHHLGIRYDGQGLDYFIPPDQEIDLSKNLPPLSIGAYNAFVIGATHFTKRVPEAQIIQYCKKSTLPIVLLGGSAEQEQGKRIADHSSHIINQCGVLSLHQSASMVRQAHTILTHDTGLMHVAAAFRKHIISFWGNTIPEFGMYPFYPEGMDLNINMEVLGLSCRPCSKIGYDRCPKGHFKCMTGITLSKEF